MMGRARRRPFLAVGPLPRHPYRDSAIFHGGLAALIVIMAWLVGSELLRAALVAVVYFLLATAWSWWRFHQRARSPSPLTDKKP